LVDNFKFVISAIGGAFVTGIFGLLLQKLKNSGSNEGIYAQQFLLNVEKINSLVDERADLKSKNSRLESELNKVKTDLKTQKKVTDQLTCQIGELNRKIKSEENK